MYVCMHLYTTESGKNKPDPRLGRRPRRRQRSRLRVPAATERYLSEDPAWPRYMIYIYVTHRDLYMDLTLSRELNLSRT